MNEGLTLGEALTACLDCSAGFFGDSAGAFSAKRARLIEADEELARRGLFDGFNVSAIGETEKLLALSADAESGDAAAFEAAMRYVGLKLYELAVFPPPLAALAANVLSGRIERPQKRKAKETGLRGRNIAVYALVEVCRTGGKTTAEEAYTMVAGLLLTRKKQPNNPRTVKKIYLATRALMAGPLTIHDLAVLQSFPFLPNEIASLAERAMEASIASRELAQDDAYRPPVIQGQDT